jgi:hypothetical protein
MATRASDWSQIEAPPPRVAARITANQKESARRHCDECDDGYNESDNDGWVHEAA